MSILAAWCFRHRVAVLVGWALLVAVLGGAVALVGTPYSTTFELAGTDSDTARRLVGGDAGGGDAGTVVLRATSGTLVTDTRAGAVRTALDRVAACAFVARVAGPDTPDGLVRRSADGRIAYAEVVLDRPVEQVPADRLAAVRAAVLPLAGDGVEVTFGGSAFGTTTEAPGSTGEIVGLVAAAVVLWLVFGSLVATAIPLLCGLFALTAAAETVGLLAHVVDIAAVGPRAATLVGLGVGIDYALFVLTRYREALDAGQAPEVATTRALATSGRAVVSAGASVVLAMAGLLIPGVGFLRGIGLAAAVVVVFAVVASVTVVPALFGVFGTRVQSRRGRSAATAARPVRTSVARWTRWSRYVERHPVALGAVAVAMMLVLAAPLADIRLGTADQGTDPPGSSSRQAHDLLAATFGPGVDARLLVVVRTAAPVGPAAVDTLAARIAATPGVAAVGQVVRPDPRTAVLTVEPTTGPQAAATARLVDTLRSPSWSADGVPTRVHVGGATASLQDFTTVLTRSLPWFLVFVGLASSLTLLITFRSVAVAVTSVVVNLLAAAASLGVVVAVFQWGWGPEVFGPDGCGPVDAFLPVLLVAILIGLSTDYQVFLVGRMREEWVRTGDHPRAVRTGQVATGPVITAAATIMVSVFLAFAVDGQREIAEFGVGLAVAVLVDAWVLRTVLVPAAMFVGGPPTWWMPAWGDRALSRLARRRPRAPVAVASVVSAPAMALPATAATAPAAAATVPVPVSVTASVPVVATSVPVAVSASPLWPGQVRTLYSRPRPGTRPLAHRGARARGR